MPRLGHHFYGHSVRCARRKSTATTRVSNNWFVHCNCRALRKRKKSKVTVEEPPKWSHSVFPSFSRNKYRGFFVLLVTAQEQQQLSSRMTKQGQMGKECASAPDGVCVCV